MYKVVRSLLRISLVLICFMAWDCTLALELVGGAIVCEIEWANALLNLDLESGG